MENLLTGDDCDGEGLADRRGHGFPEIVFSGAYPDIRSKSLSLCKTVASCSMAIAAMRQSMRLRMVTPRFLPVRESLAART